MVDKYFLNSRGGFALIMSLLVVSVVITAGLTILDVSIKQVRLSGSAKDSEIAFSAASAGLECGRYWRRVEMLDMENTPTGNQISLNCFGATQSVNPTAVSVTNGVGNAYSYEFGWGSGVDARCSRMTTIVIISNPLSTSTVALNTITGLLPGYPGVSAKSCPPAGICTILSSRGYNRSCATTNAPGTIEREVLLEY